MERQAWGNGTATQQGPDDDNVTQHQMVHMTRWQRFQKVLAARGHFSLEPSVTAYKSWTEFLDRAAACVDTSKIVIGTYYFGT